MLPRGFYLQLTKALERTARDLRPLLRVGEREAQHVCWCIARDFEERRPVRIWRSRLRVLGDRGDREQHRNRQHKENASAERVDWGMTSSEHVVLQSVTSRLHVAPA